MNSAMRVNEVISTRTASAAGTPSRANWRSCCQSRRSMRCHSAYGRYTAWLCSSQSASNAIVYSTTSVAQAQPTTPIDGMPAPPKQNQIESGNLIPSEASCSHVTSCGLPIPWLSVLYSRNKSAGGSANASTRR